MQVIENTKKLDKNIVQKNIFSELISKKNPSNFIKFNQQVNNITGSYRATLILGILEYWFKRKPDGFYKYIEPCSRKLCKEGDSWTEVLNCNRKSYISAFEIIGTRYKSRTAFKTAEDVFQGKLYASYYDRDTNQTLFLRNHNLADETLKPLLPTAKKPEKQKINKPLKNLPSTPICNGNVSHSSIEPQTTPGEVSKDTSHAGSKIIEEMIDIWKCEIEPDVLINLKSRLIAFLKQAFKDKFDSCLEKWTQFCQKIASIKFLMGESKSKFKATLEWALKFDIIDKILSNFYGAGDRRRPEPIITLEEVEQEIEANNAPPEIKVFQKVFLKITGPKVFRQALKDVKLEFREGTLVLTARTVWQADRLENNNYSTLLLSLKKSTDIEKLVILAPKEDLLKSRRIIEKPEVRIEHAAEIQQYWEEKAKNHSQTPNLENISQDIPDYEQDSKKGENVVTPTILLKKELVRYCKYQQLSEWLFQLKVKEITEEGTVIITFRDDLQVEWCKVKYLPLLVRACQKLFPKVNRVKVFVENQSLTGSNLVELPKVELRQDSATDTDTFSKLNLALETLDRLVSARERKEKEILAC